MPLNWNEYISAERSNKYRAAAIKKREKQLVTAQCKGLRYTGGYPCEVTVRAHFNARRSDLDNVRIKGVLDGLVHAGVIENDNLKHIQKLTIVPVFDNRKVMEIEIKELQ